MREVAEIGFIGKQRVKSCFLHNLSHRFGLVLRGNIKLRNARVRVCGDVEALEQLHILNGVEGLDVVVDFDVFIRHNQDKLKRIFGGVFNNTLRRVGVNEAFGRLHKHRVLTAEFALRQIVRAVLSEPTVAKAYAVCRDERAVLVERNFIGGFVRVKQLVKLRFRVACKVKPHRLSTVVVGVSLQKRGFDVGIVVDEQRVVKPHKRRSIGFFAA